jgi:hypothetical protein
MNPFQRTGVFLIRILGLVAVFIGVLGLGYALGVTLGVISSVASSPPSFVASVLWLAAGLGLSLAAVPVGRWLGSGLD